LLVILIDLLLPVAGGLTIREGMYIAEELALTGETSSLDSGQGTL